MNNQELFRLFKDSRLAQLAKPTSKQLRGKIAAPTHQIIYTPKSSAIRSNFGIKTALPQQVGMHHIVFNDIDNAQNMPDVERYSGPLYNRLKFQELNVPVRSENNQNPLFKSESTKTPTTAKEVDTLNDDSVTIALNLPSNSPTHKVKKILQKNPDLYRKYQQYMLQNNPDKVGPNTYKSNSRVVSEFLNSAKDVKKGRVNFLKDANTIQGTGGFSYLQKGRLTNTPNGVKYGTIAPGRLLDKRDGGIAGFVASVTDHTSLQRNYTKSYPGKHQRQFVVPFKIDGVEITERGKIRMEANGVQVNSWNDRVNESNTPQPSFNNRGASERMASDMQQFSALLSVLDEPAK